MTDETVEVTDTVSPLDAVRQMMDKMATGDVVGAQADFQSAIGARADSLIADRKAEIASAIFNNPEMQKMGLEAEEPEAEEPETEE